MTDGPTAPAPAAHGDDAVICDQLVLGESFGQRFMGLMGRASMAAARACTCRTSSIHMMFMRFPIDALFVAKADDRAASAGGGAAARPASLARAS